MERLKKTRCSGSTVLWNYVGLYCGGLDDIGGLWLYLFDDCPYGEDIRARLKLKLFRFLYNAPAAFMTDKQDGDVLLLVF